MWFEGYQLRKEREKRMVAWHLANLMNRLRWSRSTPRVTINQLMGTGRDLRSFSSRADYARTVEEHNRQVSGGS